MGVRSVNNTLQSFLDTFVRSGTDGSGEYVSIPPAGLTATGGVISDYTSGPAIYRAHIFTSSGTFAVSALSTDPTLPNSVEYLVVAGGGGGGGHAAGGGGGGGGFRTNLSGHPLAGSAYPISVGPYTVTIGSGGNGGTTSPNPSDVTSGTNSNFYPTPVGYPSSTYIRSDGGGAGSGGNPGVAANSGGSGGGGGGFNYPGGSGNTPPYSPSQGNPGGTAVDRTGAGGGGAGGAGQNSPGTSQCGYGGIGVSCSIAGPAANEIGAPGPSPGRWFAGGGGGGAHNPGATGGTGGGPGGPYAGGANGSPSGPNVQAPSGAAATGGGGGGSGGLNGVNPGSGGNGGSGIVVVRYQIGTIQTGTAKATGVQSVSLVERLFIPSRVLVLLHHLPLSMKLWNML